MPSPKKSKSTVQPSYDPQKLYTYDNSIATERVLALEGGPFVTGDWRVLCQTLPNDEEEEDGMAWLRIRWADAEPAPIMQLNFVALIETELGTHSEEIDLVGAPTRWPQTRSGELCIMIKCRGFYVDEHHPRIEMQAPWRKNGTPLLSSHFQSLTLYLDPPTEGDVRLIFPSIGAELLSTSSLLSQHSAYFRSLLHQQTEQGGKVTKAGSKKRVRQSAPKEFDWRDSDDEEDLQLLVARSRSSEVRTYEEPTHELVVTETAFSTYRALLFHLHTDRPLEFKPLASLQPKVEHHTLGHLASDSPPPPSPFPRASPRSMYRLASILNIRPIAERALKEYGKQLEGALEHVVDEAFCETSMAHAELRNTVVAVALLHAEEVKKSVRFQVLASTPVGRLTQEQKEFLRLMKAVR